MAEVAELWEKILPPVRNGVTGIGVWTALSSSVPIVFEDDVLVIGVPPGQSELGGHLRMPATSRLIEQTASKEVGRAVKVRVIDGVQQSDWDLMKRRDAERRRMQEADMVKMKAQLETRTSWEAIYERLTREYSSLANRSLPQNRARFFDAAASIVADARKEQTNFDDMNERNFARCIERISQYTEIASALVAYEVLKRAEEI